MPPACCSSRILLLPERLVAAWLRIDAPACPMNPNLTVSGAPGSAIGTASFCSYALGSIASAAASFLD